MSISNFRRVLREDLWALGSSIHSVICFPSFFCNFKELIAFHQEVLVKILKVHYINKMYSKLQQMTAMV